MSYEQVAFVASFAIFVVGYFWLIISTVLIAEDVRKLRVKRDKKK